MGQRLTSWREPGGQLLSRPLSSLPFDVRKSQQSRGYRRDVDRRRAVQRVTSEGGATPPTAESRAPTALPCWP
jgi:hypothetical protein